MSRIFYWLLIFSCCLNINAQNDLENSVREVGLANFSIEVKEVTTPDISVAPDGKTILTQLIGGIMMGVGAAFAGGCNIGNMLSGVAVLAVGSLLVTVFIALGCWVMTYLLFMRD